MIGSLLRFKPEGNYPEFHNAVGMVLQHSLNHWFEEHVRVKWVQPVHYAVDSDHYKLYGPATVSDFSLDRFEIINLCTGKK
jgi:hypothetical protein